MRQHNVLAIDVQQDTNLPLTILGTLPPQKTNSMSTQKVTEPSGLSSQQVIEAVTSGFQHRNSNDDGILTALLVLKEVVGS